MSISVEVPELTRRHISVIIGVETLTDNKVAVFTTEALECH